MSHLSTQKRYYWKGKIVSKKIFERRTFQSEALKNRKVETPAETPVESEDVELNEKVELNEEVPTEKNEAFVAEDVKPGKGRHIVELLYLAEELWCKSCKECLSFENIEREQRQGLGSILAIRCHKCLLINIVTTGKQHSIENSFKRPTRFDVNSKLDMGMYSSEI